MKVRIDRELCLESGQCAYMQPTVFELDATGTPQVIIAELNDDAVRQAARDAEELCPSQAIIIDD